MRCLVVYDIVDDAIRAKVADICLDYGLQRFQYSAFLGELSPNYQQELLLKVKRRLGKHQGNVSLFPICERDFAFRREVGTPRPWLPMGRRDLRVINERAHETKGGRPWKA